MGQKFRAAGVSIDCSQTCASETLKNSKNLPCL